MWASESIFELLYGWRGTVVSADDFLPALVFVCTRSDMWFPFAHLNFLRDFVEDRKTAMNDYYLTCFERTFAHLPAYFLHLLMLHTFLGVVALTHINDISVEHLDHGNDESSCGDSPSASLQDLLRSPMGGHSATTRWRSVAGIILCLSPKIVIHFFFCSLFERTDSDISKSFRGSSAVLYRGSASVRPNASLDELQPVDDAQVLCHAFSVIVTV